MAFKRLLTAAVVIGVLSCTLVCCHAATLPPRFTNLWEGSDGRKLRLTGRARRRSNEGTVEVSINGTWGSICDNGFTTSTANVICRMLGYSGDPQAHPKARFGRLVRSQPIWFDDLRCTGEELDIFQCSHGELGQERYGCSSHRRDAGVRCRLPAVQKRPQLEVRLYCPDGHEGNCNTCPTERRPGLGNATSGDCGNVTSVAGFVQVKLRELNDDWVFVSAEGWSETDMEVACHQLGYPNQFGCPDAADLLGCDPANNTACGGSEFQRDIGLVTMVNMECKGKENTLGRCPHLGWGPTANPPRQVAAVACGYSGQHRCPTGANTRVRLRAGPIPSTGRLEVLHEGEWGTVCGNDKDFTLPDGNVACLSMGFGSAKSIAYDGNLGKGFDRVWLNKVACSGKESFLEECQHPGFGAINDYWCERHYHDVGLVCNSPQDGSDCDPHVRFHVDDPDGPHVQSYADRYLEVNVEGEWGLVCFEALGRSVLTVLCRDLEGKFGQWSRPGTPRYYSSTKRYLGRLDCDGSEVTVEECQLMFVEVANCSEQETTVECTEYLPDLVPDLTTFQNSFYRPPKLGGTHSSYRYQYLDWVPVSRLQCEIEEGCIAPNATDGFRHLMRFAVMSYNFGLVPFRPFEPQADWEFHQCHNHYHSHETFAHYELLFPDGRTAAEGRKISFCLVDSICINRVKTFTGCQEGEPQGISPCCGDLYSRNTPCQWIDVTNVTAGDYVIRVTVSPNQEVSEMDFENNQISCNISLDESRRVTLGACARRGYSSLAP